MGTLEVKIHQHIAGLWQEFLYEIFVDFHNNYDTMGKGHTPVILEG